MARRARGLVGYDIALTRRGSRVRIASGPSFSFFPFSSVKSSFRLSWSIPPAPLRPETLIDPEPLPASTLLNLFPPERKTP